MRSPQHALWRGLTMCAVCLLIVPTTLARSETAISSSGVRPVPHAKAGPSLHPHGTSLRDVTDVGAYQQTIRNVEASGTATTGSADANHIELIVHRMFPANLFADDQLEWEWVDPVTGNMRNDALDSTGQFVRSMIRVGTQLEGIYYKGKEVGIDTVPALAPGSVIAQVENGSRANLTSGANGWKDTGTTRNLGGHTLHVYELDGVTRFPDEVTDPTVGFAYVDPMTFLTYREELYRVHNNVRTLYSWSEDAYYVVSRSSALQSNVFSLVHIGRFVTPKPISHPKV